MVKTRSSSSSPQASDEDSNSVSDPSVSPKSSKLPASDASRQVKIVIAKKTTIGLPVYRLPSPKTGSHALYVVCKDFCAEVIQSPTEYRSWFYDDDVIEDGSFRLYSPVHPLFLALPGLHRLKDKFIVLEEILTDETECLIHNDQLQRTISSVADVKEVCDTNVYRFSQEKTLEWMRTRLEKVKAAMVDEGSLHKAILNDAAALDRYCFGILGDYIPAELYPIFKKHLNIQDTPALEAGERQDYSYKRKIEEDPYTVEKPVKKPKEPVVKKQLAQASKGTMSISTFFGKK